MSRPVSVRECHPVEAHARSIDAAQRVVGQLSTPPPRRHTTGRTVPRTDMSIAMNGRSTRGGVPDPLSVPRAEDTTAASSLSVHQCHTRTDGGRQGHGVRSDAMTSPARLTIVHSAAAQPVRARTGRTTSHARLGPSGRSMPRAATKVTEVFSPFVKA